VKLAYDMIKDNKILKENVGFGVVLNFNSLTTPLPLVVVAMKH
jgi:hypothetical protein